MFILDAHCHTFNASDLSIDGFFSEVIVDSDERLPQRLIDPLVRVLVRLAVRAPSADDELQYLDRRQAGKASRTLDIVEDSVVTERAARDAEHQANIEAEIIRLSESSDSGDQALFQAILDEVLPPGAEPMTMAREETFLPRVARSIKLSRGTISRYLLWVGRLRQLRSVIIDELIRTYGSGEDGVTLFASALVDFERWLDSKPKTPISAQIPLCGRLSRAFAGRVHFLAPYDPLREVKAQTSREGSLFWVKEAIAHHGFLGVKLYPPMGFAATGNAELDFSASGHANSRELGTALDGALDALFEWAVAEEVPVMAHCNRSNQSKRCYKERASPEFWKRALAKHPGLRLNLGHFGGQENLANGGNDWPERIIELMEIPGQHVYTDVGNFNMRDDARRTEWFASLKSVMQAHAGLASRLMYGSDWLMLAKSERSDEFLELFREGLSAVSPPETVRAVMGGNARDFFGLNPGDKARGRLESFYDENDLPRPGWLS